MKTPANILILAESISFEPEKICKIDYSPSDTKYDLVICVSKCLRLHLKNPFCIADAEIFFERGETLTPSIFDRALLHYSNCEIRNGV